MCGIFGISTSNEIDRLEFKLLSSKSQRRGSDSSGLIRFQDNHYSIERADFQISRLLSEVNTKNTPLILGHSRLITDGESDNQPVERDGLALIHNGIMIDSDRYWSKSNTKRRYEIDSEVILDITIKHINQEEPIEELHKKIQDNCHGSFSCALVVKNIGKLILMSNTGSLYYGNKDTTLYFASENHFLSHFSLDSVDQIIGTRVFDIPSSDTNFDIKDRKVRRKNLVPSLVKNINKENKLIFPTPNLRRCSKCILPETMPFIDFDSHGECNYCKNYVLKNKPRHKDDLKNILNRYLSISGNKCIVPFSGGRDSSYMLHLIKKEFDMSPITMTYDWGMVTDLARRNISRMCASLEVENILIADNIEKKRRNIKLNLLAWLDKPHLGMVNILMAGDKHFFRHIETIRKETGISLNIWGMNPLEVTHFKAGFLGFPPDFAMEQVFNTGMSGQTRYQLLRAKEILRNPRYLNRSLWDTLSGEYHRSVKKQIDFYNLFDFWYWDENEIENILDLYHWERAPDTRSSWRIGDGTAAFYNYIYYTMAGFTEDDDMLSSMVREKYITRNEALKRSIDYSQPRNESIKEYMQMIGLNYEETLSTINSAKKIF